MGSGFETLDLRDRCQVPQLSPARWHARTSGSSDAAEAGGGSGITRTLEHSASSFSPNTRSSSGIESFRAASRDMVVVTTSGDRILRLLGFDFEIGVQTLKYTRDFISCVVCREVLMRLSDPLHNRSAGSSVP